MTPFADSVSTPTAALIRKIEDQRSKIEAEHIAKIRLLTAQEREVIAGQNARRAEEEAARAKEQYYRAKLARLQ